MTIDEIRERMRSLVSMATMDRSVGSESRTFDEILRLRNDLETRTNPDDPHATAAPNIASLATPIRPTDTLSDLIRTASRNGAAGITIIIDFKDDRPCGCHGDDDAE